MCDNFLLTYHKSDLLDIIESPDEFQHFSININFIVLFDHDTSLGNKILSDADSALEELENGAKIAQESLIAENGNGIFKMNIHCRIFCLPLTPELHRDIFPNIRDVSKFLQISGTVVRISEKKLLEFQKQFTCVKCKMNFIVKSQYDEQNRIPSPRKCKNPDCPGTKFNSSHEVQPNFCKDYQEIKIQEQVSQLGFGSVPGTLLVTLEDDLVDTCKPGDNVTICGILKRRWFPLIIGKVIEMEVALKANHIQINNMCGLPNVITPEIETKFNEFWKNHEKSPIIGRDIILNSFCPQLFGLHIVKLAVAVVLAGGAQTDQDTISTGVRIRSEPHLLLVGDPGTGKSHLLRFASKVASRSVLTTGVGSTAAGLTVAAVHEGGEWHLEGGALVLADGGVCCIDEFNSMKEHDRTSIHEAMEQQTISVAKASIVCKLSTKCSIIAATNPKGNLDRSLPLCMNVALPSPLLSRFDLVLLLKDSVEEEWDLLVTHHVLNDTNFESKLVKKEEWSLETLQAYFTLIKKIQPKLTEESNQILSNYYQLQRRQVDRNKSRTTVRLLDSLVRLSKGHARLLFHENVEVIDAIMAVVLVEIGMGNYEDSMLGLNLDLRRSFAEDSMENYVELVRIVLEKLELPDILSQEISSIRSGYKPNVVQSNYFRNDAQMKCEESIFEDDNDDFGSFL